VDRELNNGIIGYIIYIDESLREKEESVCKVGRVFPRYVPCTYLIGELPLSRPRVAYTLRLYNYLLRFYLTLREYIFLKNMPIITIRIISSISVLIETLITSNYANNPYKYIYNTIDIIR